MNGFLRKIAFAEFVRFREINHVFFFFVVIFDLKKGRKMRAENLKKRVGKKNFQAVCIQRYMKE